MKQFPILFQDENLVAIDKPAGYHVHPPESGAEKVPRHKIILHQLRQQLGKFVYPLHRLDVATSGILVFALNPETARSMGMVFQSQNLEKTYWAVVRGHLPDRGEVNEPLLSDSSNEMLAAQTLFQTLKRIEIPYPVGKKFPMARYSWLQVQPKTGRFHQIRRHMNRISRPLLGDAAHGDSHHNRFFREQLQIPGLCLRAVRMKLPYPSDQVLEIEAPAHWKWQKIDSLFSTTDWGFLQNKPESSRSEERD